MPTTGVAMITGGASGFGRALAEQCAARGFAVGLLDIDGDRVAQEAAAIAAAHGARVVGRRVDVASSEDVAAAADELGTAFGRCDLLWANVGVQHFGAVEAVPDDSEADLTTAEDAAARALAGVLAGEPHVITHGELAAAVAEHHGEIDRALAQLATRRNHGGAA